MIGHDQAESLVNEQLLNKAAKDGSDLTIDVFFAGVGDARNLMATLNTISEAESVPPANRYRFIANDVKPHAVARNLLVMMLLQEFAQG